MSTTRHFLTPTGEFESASSHGELLLCCSKFTRLFFVVCSFHSRQQHAAVVLLQTKNIPKPFISVFPPLPPPATRRRTQYPVAPIKSKFLSPTRSCSTCPYLSKPAARFRQQRKGMTTTTIGIETGRKVGGGGGGCCMGITS